MIMLVAVILLAMTVVSALAVVRTHSLFGAVIWNSIFSLLMALNFFLLDAPDVALTEAAVGAGFTTVLFLGALALTTDAEHRRRLRRWLPLAVVVATAAVLMYAGVDKPDFGDPQAAPHRHVAPWYLQNTQPLIGIPNVVTAVLGSFRGYDTLGETFVVFTAAIGVLFLMSAGRGPTMQLPARDPARQTRGQPHNLIPRVVGKLALPFIFLFGFYVQAHGEQSPGGGFQAGVIVATGFILYALLQGERAALAVLPPRVLMGLLAGGVLLYAGVGVACALLGGDFLDYSALVPGDALTGQHLGLILIELGVGLSVTGALLTAFHAFAAREQKN